MSKCFLRVVLIALFTSITAACSFLAPKSTPNAADLEKEEQAVYAALLNNRHGPVVILQDTATDISSDGSNQTLDYIKSGLKGLSNETLDNFLERNQQPSRLSSDMQIGVDYVLLSQDELSGIFKQPDGWQVFNEKYPRSGYTVFSRVGFNNDLDQALVYSGTMAGPLAGAGYYYRMEKVNGQWNIKEQIMVWIS